MHDHWPQRRWEPLDIAVGPCAWRLPLLLAPDAQRLAHRPSLLVALPDDADSLLQQAAKVLPAWPLLLVVQEPTFIRRLRGVIEQRLALLGVAQVAAVVVWTDDVRDLKAGGLMQTMTQLRDEGVVTAIGLAHDDVLSCEWLALHTPARLLVTPYHLHNQSARYRTLPTLAENGMAALAWPPVVAGDEMALAFAVAESARALPVLDFIPESLPSLDDDQAQALWSEYQREHPAPPPLPRSSPPVGAG